MEWIVALVVMIAAVTVLPWWLGIHSDAARKGAGGAGGFLSGLAEQFDPRAALVREENEKQEAMEGEQDSGAPPS